MLSELSKLCALHGVSGDTDSVRAYIAERVALPHTVDAKGNLIFYKKGRSSSKKLMVTAHMDEVGLMVTGFTPEGYLKFASVGGIDARVMVSKTVAFKNGLYGVIGQKAVHLQSASEREADPKEDKLVIDIGALSMADAMAHVRIGDTAAFMCPFTPLGETRFAAKALDDRVGLACLMQLLTRDYDFDFYGVFTDLEEIGGLGAKAAAERIRPDASLVLEGTTCSDNPSVSEKDFVTRCGGGVCLPVRDRSMVGDRALVSSLIRCAEKNNIPWQYKKTTAGGTDGGAIHTSAGGIKTAVMAVPVRYIHSACSVADMRDLEAFFLLAEKFTERAGEIL